MKEKINDYSCIVNMVLIVGLVEVLIVLRFIYFWLDIVKVGLFFFKGIVLLR